MNRPNITGIIGTGIRMSSGDFAYGLYEEILLIRVKGKGKEERILISFIRFMLSQLRISYELIKISKNIRFMKWYGAAGGDND